MSGENVEIVRRAFAFEVHGRGDPAEALTDFDPDLVLNPVEEAPSHGPDAVRDYYERWESLYTLRDGKIVRLDEFTERDEALKAAGLAE